MAVLRHTLTPRMKASHIAIETMKSHLDAVYDITVAYEGTLDASGQRRPAPSMPGKQTVHVPEKMYTLSHAGEQFPPFNLVSESDLYLDILSKWVKNMSQYWTYSTGI